MPHKSIEFEKRAGPLFISKLFLNRNPTRSSSASEKCAIISTRVWIKDIVTNVDSNRLYRWSNCDFKGSNIDEVQQQDTMIAVAVAAVIRAVLISVTTKITRRAI